MDLRQIQSLLSRSLEPDAAPEAGRVLQRLLCRDAAIDPEQAVSIYRRNVEAALLKALRAAYPACLRILGEGCFAGLARVYLRSAPSRRADLNRYGKGFGAFLDAWVAAHAAFAEYVYLGDLARLEWCCHRAYYQPAVARFDFAALARISPADYANMRWSLAATLSLLQSAYPVSQLRARNLAGDEAQWIAADALPERLVITRDTSGTVQIVTVSALLFEFLTACRQGWTLGQIMTRFGGDAETMLGQVEGLIAQGWINGFQVLTEANNDLGAAHV